MKRQTQTLALVFLVLLFAGVIYFVININKEENNMNISEEMIKLPEPKKNSNVSLEETLASRRSVREYSDKKISLENLSQLLWAAQGLTSETGRTAPSAGALYPMELYIVGSFGDYEPGIYHYSPASHSLELKKRGDFLEELSEIGLGQEMIKEAEVNILVTGVINRTAEKYGEKAEQYVALEAGHVGQNIYLQATALELGTVAVGAFYDDQIEKFLSFEESQKAYYIFPIGGLK